MVEEERIDKMVEEYRDHLQKLLVKNKNTVSDFISQISEELEQENVEIALLETTNQAYLKAIEEYVLHSKQLVEELLKGSELDVKMKHFELQNNGSLYRLYITSDEEHSFSIEFSLDSDMVKFTNMSRFRFLNPPVLYAFRGRIKSIEEVVEHKEFRKRVKELYHHKKQSKRK